MTLGVPVWLWLSFAILIPVIIHLWNKKSGRPRLLGTFRFLPEESFASAKRIELHEVPLMLVRILIIVLLTLLLAGLFWEKEIEVIERMIIEETSNGVSEWSETEEGIPLVGVSSKEVEQKGWWNIIEQVEYGYQPKRITIRGDLSEENFRGARPVINATLDWETSDSLYKDELILAAWEFSEEQYKALIQRSTDNGIQTFSEEVALSEIQNNEIEILKEPKFIFNSENSEAVNFGLLYAAEVWEIEVEEQSMLEVARLELEENIIRLVQESEELGGKDLVEANSVFGVSLFVKEMKLDVQPQKEILGTRNENIPFIYIDTDGNLVVNGSVEEELKSWFFASIANRLITEALEVGDFLTPELIEDQRKPVSVSSNGRPSSPVEQQSAKLWLVFLLALSWLAERTLAPRRGM